MIIRYVCVLILHLCVTLVGLLSNRPLGCSAEFRQNVSADGNEIFLNLTFLLFFLPLMSSSSRLRPP